MMERMAPRQEREKNQNYPQQKFLPPTTTKNKKERCTFHFKNADTTAHNTSLALGCQT
jgi:hypothetical protein